MRKENRGVKVFAMNENNVIGVKVEMTKKTTISGKIIYAVVVTNMNTGVHYRIFTFDGINGAYKQYKLAIGR